jgi:hypothetical protein
LAGPIRQFQRGKETMNSSLIRVVLAGCVVGALACGSAPPAPSATAGATPAPTPVPSATPQAFSCPLPPMKDLHNDCPKVGSQMLDRVNAGVDTVLRTQPQLFDFNDQHGGSVRVLDHHAYQTAVVAAINAQGGICAKDDNEEIALKISNDFNEQFNIWTSAGYTRRSYISTCFPAQF